MSGFSANTIVVPIDFSDESIEAIDTALEISEQPSQVHVVHVLPDVEPREMDLLRGIDDEARKKHAMDALQERLANSKYDGIQFAIEVGDAGQRIVHLAESIQAGLIVTPSHGRSGIKRLLLGSVAERILRLAHCTVLVLRK